MTQRISVTVRLDTGHLHPVPALRRSAPLCRVKLPAPLCFLSPGGHGELGQKRDLERAQRRGPLSKAGLEDKEVDKHKAQISPQNDCHLSRVCSVAVTGRAKHDTSRTVSCLQHVYYLRARSMRLTRKPSLLIKGLSHLLSKNFLVTAVSLLLPTSTCWLSHWLLTCL